MSTFIKANMPKSLKIFKMDILHSCFDYRVAQISETSYPLRADGWTESNYRKDSLFKIDVISHTGIGLQIIFKRIFWLYQVMLRLKEPHRVRTGPCQIRTSLQGI